MLYLNHPEISAVAILEGPNDEAVASMTGIIKASGMFDDLNWYRAFDSGELKQIYEVASTKMTEYVSARSFVTISTIIPFDCRYKLLSIIALDGPPNFGSRVDIILNNFTVLFII